jgi:hypothetical protein
MPSEKIGIFIRSVILSARTMQASADRAAHVRHDSEVGHRVVGCAHDQFGVAPIAREMALDWRDRVRGPR